MKHIKLFEQFINEALKASKPNDVITTEVDMSYDDTDKEEMKAVQAVWKKFNLKVKELKGGQGTEHEVTGKKKDILSYLQSEFYEMDDDTIEDYYPELLEGNSFDIHTVSVTEGKISYDKVAKALYGTTSASEIPEMDQFLGVKPGDMVTVITVPLNQGSELFSFVTSLPKGSAWMIEKSIFSSKTMYAAFKNMSQSDFDSLKSQFPRAEIHDLDLFTRIKTRAKAVANFKRIKDVDSVEDSASKY